MDIVEVIWTDAGFTAHEVELTDVKEQQAVNSRTVGYLMDEDKNRLVLAMTIFPDAEIMRFTWVIPKAYIKKVRHIGKG